MVPDPSSAPQITPPMVAAALGAKLLGTCAVGVPENGGVDTRTLLASQPVFVRHVASEFPVNPARLKAIALLFEP